MFGYSLFRWSLFYCPGEAAHEKRRNWFCSLVTVDERTG